MNVLRKNEKIVKNTALMTLSKRNSFGNRMRNTKLAFRQARYGTIILVPAFPKGYLRS
jgi:hypothetical protein